MGDPKRSTNTWSRPNHPWQKTRIESERVLKAKYGLKNMREIWKMISLLKKFKDQAKNLAAGSGSQVDKEKSQLLHRAASLGLLTASQGLDDVLGLTTENVMDRRLQTVVFKKGLARSMEQSRQFIVHQHIMLGATKITAPGYIVKISEESSIHFVPTSHLASADHPERALPMRVPKPQPPKEEMRQDGRPPRKFDKRRDRKQQMRPRPKESKK